MCTWERHCHVWTIFYGNHIRTALESDEGRIKVRVRVTTLGRPWSQLKVELKLRVKVTTLGRPWSQMKVELKVRVKVTTLGRPWSQMKVELK